MNTMPKKSRSAVSSPIRRLSQTWLNLTGRKNGHGKPAAKNTETTIGDVPLSNPYRYTHNTGEMNHVGRYMCGFCEGEMCIVLLPHTRSHSGEPDVPGTAGADYQWQCGLCGRLDDSSFRLCKCGRKTILDKYGASAPEMPVSLSAGGCTACEHCVLCDGVLAVGNVKWFSGHWTHTYPVSEFDPKTQEQYTVWRERSKYYGFHCHYSCYANNLNAVEQIIVQRTPDWFKQGQAEQERAEALQLRQEGRCVVCKEPLGFWDRIRERDRHARCRR